MDLTKLKQFGPLLQQALEAACDAAVAYEFHIRLLELAITRDWLKHEDIHIGGGSAALSLCIPQGEKLFSLSLPLSTAIDDSDAQGVRNALLMELKQAQRDARMLVEELPDCPAGFYDQHHSAVGFERQTERAMKKLSPASPSKSSWRFWSKS